ncbi:glycosyltransferase family 4 protein [Hahella aquimaris]|uniref:glycosyltransferase family 4 protein n=1 Tax=Hahella sp. HNIBRBA332 TaxID=3015983 RepID=UPI00273CEC61|nr:glycosyltransferase family 4 protein [Hahella sp. HNIBRBA332]WLQ16849.1 glycosyltransferase family 4 protein [Hahella sp. HNIBRBA332]
MQNSRPHLTHVASGDVWAGAEKQLYELCKALIATNSLDLSAILFNDGVLAEKLRQLNIGVTVADEAKLSPLAMIRGIRNHFIKHNSNILHTHGFKENILGVTASIKSPVTSVVRTIHGGSESNISWKTPHKKAIHIADQLLTRHKVDRIVAVSGPLYQSLSKRHPSKVVKIFNFINSRELETISPGKPPGEAFTIGIVGRLAPVKRIDLFVETIKELLKQGHHEIKGKIIGDGPLRKPIENLVHQESLTQVIEFTGFVDPSTPEIAKLDLLLMTSDHEGLPMTLLEALALKVPVVAHNVGGIPEALNFGAAGLLVDEHSALGYATAIDKVLNNPAEKERMQMNGLSYLKENFDSVKKSREYLNLYFPLLGQELSR